MVRKYLVYSILHGCLVCSLCYNIPPFFLSLALTAFFSVRFVFLLSLMPEPVIDVNSLPMPASLTQPLPDPESDDLVELPPPSSHPDAVKREKEAPETVDKPQENNDENRSIHSGDDEPSPKVDQRALPNDSDKNSGHDDENHSASDNVRDTDGPSPREAPTKFSHVFCAFLHCRSLWTNTLRLRTAFV